MIWLAEKVVRSGRRLICAARGHGLCVTLTTYIPLGNNVRKVRCLSCGRVMLQEYHLLMPTRPWPRR